LITHAGAYDDFGEYIKGIENSLNTKILKAIKDDEFVKARAFAAELTAYKSIYKAVEASARELRSQLQYQEIKTK